MIGEAIDAVFTLGWALLAWLLVLAAVGTIVLLTAAATGAWAARALWRATAGPSWARGRVRARIHARNRLRRPQEPTEPHEYREAA